MRILLNADDFGLSEETVEATIECFERGVLTSATIMPAMPATDRAIAFARSRPDLAFGVHLTFVRDPSTRPLSSPAEVASLVGKDGRLLPTREIRLRALTGRLSVEEIALEAGAQIAAAREAGIPVSHVDSHRHLHKFKPFREALRRLGLSRVRGAQDVYLRRRVLSPTYWLGRRWRRAIAGAFSTTDHFFMAGVDDPPWADELLARLGRLRGQTLEVGVHPGYHEDWRSRDRECIQTLAREAARRGHQIVSWASLGT